MPRLDPRALGEHGMIRSLRRRARSGASRWREGIGDDAAILKPRAGREIVVTTDSLVENVHFRWSSTDPRSLGRKALLVSLSDVAAMGASPLGCLLNLSLPVDTDPERLAQAHDFVTLVNRLFRHPDRIRVHHRDLPRQRLTARKSVAVGNDFIDDALRERFLGRHAVLPAEQQFLRTFGIDVPG